MSSKEQFEAWMTSEQWFHEDDFKWDESRNCYAEYGIHIAFKAYLAATASMQAERDQLAAECAALKEYISERCYIVDPKADLTANADIPAEDFQPQTPATDRFLAEQRAQGVDNCAIEIQRHGWDESEVAGIVAALDAMEIFATQLRNEVKV